MRKLLLLASLAFLYTSSVHAQIDSIPWDTVYVSADSLSFSTPTPVQEYDTLFVTMYASVVDSLLGLQVHIFDSAYINGSEPMIDSALSLSANDTMAAIARLFLLATNSTTVEYIDTTINHIRSIDIGLAYQTNASNYSYYSFIKYYLCTQNFMHLL